MKCIYCLRDKTKEAFTKAEHVLPQSFGRFQDNLTLIDTVCDECNQYFGNNLELHLARNSLEGLDRYQHGIKQVADYKSLGSKSKMIIRLEEGEFKGAYAYLAYSEEHKSFVPKPLPQIGFLNRKSRCYDYFLLDKIPARLEDYDLSNPKGIIFHGDPDLIRNKLKEKSIPFKLGGELPPTERRTHIDVMTRWTCDAEILRTIAKIAFNYFAYWEGSSTALRDNFNVIRQYIRYGGRADYPLVLPTNDPILGDEPIEGKRRLGHILTLITASDRVSVMSRIALFNNITYCVSLARNCSDLANKLQRRGHFFNLANMTVLKLGNGKTLLD